MPSHQAKGKRSSGKKQKSNAASNSTVATSKLTVDVRESNQNFIAEFAQTQTTFTHIQDTLSMIHEILPVKFRGKDLNIETGKTLLNWKPTSEKQSNEGILTYKENGQVKNASVYKKTIALMDCYDWMKNNERPNEPFTWKNQDEFVTCPENQAYIDATASSLVSKLKMQGTSPPFCQFYGSFRAVVDKFLYNLEDEIEDFRFTKWFWSAIESGKFGLCMTEKTSGRRLSLEEIKEMLKPDVDLLNDDSDSEDSEDLEDSSSSSISELDVTDLSELSLDADAELLETNDLSDLHETCMEGSRTAPKTASTISTLSHDSELSITEEYTIHSELYSMPVVVIFLEKCNETMDSLFENPEYAPANTPEKEAIWAAWLFQVCAAMTQLQSSINLTHNDLHTNNILWKPTQEEYIWYKDANQHVWRIPTYGKIFLIIDFGRSIFTINNHFCISSDYEEGGDAYGMYNFGPIKDSSEPYVGPNKSFDLCRLTCSLLRALYPRNPDGLPKGALITKDGLWEVRQTEKQVFNLLWSWLKMINGKNVLEFESGKEHYPGFELYSVIAKEVKEAVPEQQLGKPIFKNFLYTEALSTTVKCIPV